MTNVWSLTAYLSEYSQASLSACPLRSTLNQSSTSKQCRCSGKSMANKKSKAVDKWSVETRSAKAAKMRCIAAIKQAWPADGTSQERRLLPAIAIACVRHSFAGVAYGYEVVPTATCIINDAIQQACRPASHKNKLHNLMQLPLLSKAFTRVIYKSSKKDKYAINMTAVLPNASQDIRSMFPSVYWQPSGASSRASHPVNNNILSRHQPVNPAPAPGQQSNMNQPLVRLIGQPETNTVHAASAHNVASLPTPFGGTAASVHMPLPGSHEAVPFPRSARNDALYAISAHQTASPNTQLPMHAAAMQPDGGAAQSFGHSSQTGSVLEESVHSLLQLLPGAVRLPVLSHLCKLSLNG